MHSTLREKVDKIAEDLCSNQDLLSGVLDRMIEKKAAAETPAEVTRTAVQLEREVGMSKEAALATAWETYLKYTNPDFQKEGGKMPPQFMKNKGKGKDEKGDEKDEKGKNPFAKKDDDEKSEKSEKSDEKDEKKDDEKEKDGKKPFPFKSAVARELAEKLGCCGMTKEAPKAKKMEPKTAAAKSLAQRLGL